MSNPNNYLIQITTPASGPITICYEDRIKSQSTPTSIKLGIDTPKLIQNSLVILNELNLAK